MKKISALLLAGVMAATALAGCGGSNSTTAKGSSETENDWTYIQNKGEFVIGITYFEPMNYMDENGNLTGFETEFATKVCEKMGVTPKFQKIDWDSKEVERQENMSISTPYMENKQVMVAKADIADQLTSADALKGKTVVAEKKSAGEEVAQSDEFFTSADYVSVDSQAKALIIQTSR